MKLKIKDKFFNFDNRLSIFDKEHFLQTVEAKLEGNYYTILPTVTNFKLLYKVVFEKDELRYYFNQLVKEKKDSTKDLFKEYSYLYPFQKEGIIKILNSNQQGYLLSFEQGLGKTLASLGTAKIRNYQKVWVMAPASLLNQWKEEIKNWLGEDAIVYKGAKQQREKLYENCVNNKWNIISYETFKSDYGNYANLTLSTDHSLAIFDEATKLKNRKTVIYKLLQKISNRFKFKLFLTGTPVNNGLEDINNIIKLINPRLVGAINNYIIYEMKSIGWGRNARVFPEIIGYKNLDEYVKKISPIYYRKTKEQVAPQLPKKKVITLNVEQTKLHHRVKENILKELSPFEGFTLLELLECGVEVYNKSQSDNAELTKEEHKGKIENPKINILKDLISEINNQVLIFCNFKSGCELIALELENEFKNKNIGVVTSETKNKDEIASKFKNKEIDIVVATDTWAKGISFPNIDYLINYNISPSYEMYFQKQDRIHRINSTTPKFIYNLVGDIIENHIMNLLEEKVKLAEQITEGKGNVVQDSDLKKEVIRKLGLG